MNKKIILIICLAIVISVVFFFVKKNVANEKSDYGEFNYPFAKIAGKTYTIGDLTAFNNMLYHHPVRGLEDRGRFPGKRNTTTIFVETQVLYPEASALKKQVMNGLEWKWKETYYLPGQLFQVGVIDKNMGFTDEEIYEYYKKHKNELLVEFGLGDGDSLDLNNARISIIKTLFLAKFPPTEEFAALLSGGVSKLEIERKWFEQTAGDRSAFFRDMLYKRKFGTDFPRQNTKDELVGPGKLISETELNIVMGWIAKGQSVAENLVAAKMASWILFSEEAKATGFVKTEGFRKLKEQFEKFEVVRYFANEVLGDKIQSNWAPKEDFIRFAIADRSKIPTLDIGKEEIENFSDSLKTIMHEAKIIQYIHNQRTKANAQFLQRDYIDMFEKTPAQLKHEADSLASNQNTERAKRIYRDLSEWFLYAPEGVNAFLESAKLQTDSKAYTEAIKSYRNFLLYSSDNSEWCRVFFMIGYIYAEYLEKFPFAAMNYRWILQNEPDCNLASDTEFMYLHLGEPMADVEELREEAIRQGRE